MILSLSTQCSHNLSTASTIQSTRFVPTMDATSKYLTINSLISKNSISNSLSYDQFRKSN